MNAVIPTLLVLMSACGDKDDGSSKGEDSGPTGETGQPGDSGDTAYDGPCPDTVPTAYLEEWDCSLETCNGSAMSYHYATAASTKEGGFVATEQWFLFFEDGTHCIDTFEISGTTDSAGAGAYGCTDCEELYAVTWTLSEDNDCGFDYPKAFFASMSEPPDPPFSGGLMFDTHDDAGARLAEGSMRVMAAPIHESTYVLETGYGTGTSTPTGTTNGPPQDYVWASRGSCWYL
jgi:hypothetical protein